VKSRSDPTGQGWPLRDIGAIPNVTNSAGRTLRHRRWDQFTSRAGDADLDGSHDRLRLGKDL